MSVKAGYLILPISPKFYGSFSSKPRSSTFQLLAVPPALRASPALSSRTIQTFELYSLSLPLILRPNKMQSTATFFSSNTNFDISSMESLGAQRCLWIYCDMTNGRGRIGSSQIPCSAGGISSISCVSIFASPPLSVLPITKRKGVISGSTSGGVACRGSRLLVGPEVISEVCNGGRNRLVLTLERNACTNTTRRCLLLTSHHTRRFSLITHSR